MEAVMRRLTILAAMLAATAVPGAASAVTCYTVIDRSNATIYQDSEPPFDLSTEGGPAARSALRGRNEFLTISEADHCLPISAPPGSTTYRAATVDEIVSGIRDYARTTSGSTTTSAGRGGGAPASSSAARGSSSGARKY
jgi:hypothetical protein